MLYQEQAPRQDAGIVPLEHPTPSREISLKEILMVNGTLLSFIRVSHSSHEPGGHQGVGSQQLRWQSKMDGDQASTHSAQGLPTCRRRWGLHLNTRLPSLQAGPRHGSQRATIHHDGTVGGFAASQVLAAVISQIQDLANALDTRPSRQHSVKWLVRDGIEASCGQIVKVTPCRTKCKTLRGVLQR